MPILKFFTEQHRPHMARPATSDSIKRAAEASERAAAANARAADAEARAAPVSSSAARAVQGLDTVSAAPAVESLS